MTKQSRLKELYKGFLNLLTVTVFCGVLLFSFSSCGQLEVPKKDKSPKANINVTDLATGMYLNIADDVYKNIVEDMELTDKQVEDMIKDIEEYCKAINKNSVIPVVVLSDCDYGHNTLNKNDKPCKLMCCVKKEDYEQ